MTDPKTKDEGSLSVTVNRKNIMSAFKARTHTHSTPTGRRAQKQSPYSAYDTASALRLLPLLTRPSTALSPMVRRSTLAHQHRRAGRGLEDVVHALDLERRALLVRACSYRLRDALCLGARDKVLRVGAALWWAEVRLAADEQDGYRRAADGADLFYPLWES